MTACVYHLQGPGKHHWHCGPGCIAGVTIAGVAGITALAALAAIVLITRRQRNTGPAQGSTYERFQPGLAGQTSNAALMHAEPTPSFEPDPLLQRPVVRSESESSAYGKHIELTTPT